MTVSVVTPVFNASKKLEKYLKSIQEQSFSDLQIVLVDDGSTDGSLEICQATAQEDARITVLHQKNAGPAAARNTGLDAAGGEWIVFVDADDRLEQDYIEHMVNAAQETEADIVASDCMMLESNRAHPFGMTVAGRVYESREMLWEAFLSDKLAWSLWAKLYRASLFVDRRFNKNDYIAEDLDMNVRLFLVDGLRLASIDSVGYWYCIDEGTVDHSFTQRHLCQLEIFERVVLAFRASGIICNASAEVFYEERVLNALRKAIDAGALRGTVKEAFERAVALHRDEALRSPFASASLKRRLQATKMGLTAFAALHKIHP